MKRQDLTPHDEYEATYCPEDDKLRLYVGRVPRDEYEYLRAEGWTSTPKQTCDFVAVWTPEREKTALHYAGYIGDEDTPPTERAADRAERFGGYLEKRTAEAIGHADTYEAGPAAHGFQSERRAEKAAARHDRQASKAETQWSKAEYWQRRTAGVISHALHKSSPGVRMGRIKVLEAELRKLDKDHEEYCELWRKWSTARDEQDPEKLALRVRWLVNRESGGHDYQHPRPETVTNEHVKRNGSSLYTLCGMVERGYGSDDITPAEAVALWFSRHSDPETLSRPWREHLRLRLAYEQQMLEAQGGRAAMVEMEVGGWLCGGSRHRHGTEWRQIVKVNKSTATGRVVSVGLMFPTHGRDRWGNDDPKAPAERMEIITVERMEADAYRPPTDEERAAFAAKVAEAKKAKAAAAKEKAAKGENCPLINPTDEDAEKLQAFWNENPWYKSNGGKPSEVLRMTQAEYAANSKGSYARCGTVTVCEKGTEHERRSGDLITRKDVYKVRAMSNGFGAKRVIIITDKPQKPVPWAAVEAARAACPSPEKLKPRAAELAAVLRMTWSSDWTDDQKQLVQDARYCGLARWASMSQFGLTEAGEKFVAAA